MKKIALYILLFFGVFFNLGSSANDLHEWSLLTQDNKPISLDIYKNKPIILHFWATWCPYCKKIQPKLVELQKKYQSSNVEIIAISFNEDEGAKPQDSIISRGFTFTTAVNGDDVAQAYGVQGTPTTFFINKKGEVIFKSTSSNVNDPRLELAMLEIIK